MRVSEKTASFMQQGIILSLLILCIIIIIIICTGEASRAGTHKTEAVPRRCLTAQSLLTSIRPCFPAWQSALHKQEIEPKPCTNKHEIQSHNQQRAASIVSLIRVQCTCTFEHFLTAQLLQLQPSVTYAKLERASHTTNQPPKQHIATLEKQACWQAPGLVLANYISAKAETRNPYRKTSPSQL